MLTRKELNVMKDADLISMANTLGIPTTIDTFVKSAIVDVLFEAQTAEIAEAYTLPSMSQTADVVAAKPAAKIRLIIHNQEGVDASKFVKVQVNGEMYAIPREVEVAVPEAVIEVLTNAVITRTEYENGVAIDKNARRFPFTVLGAAA